MMMNDDKNDHGEICETIKVYRNWMVFQSRFV